MSRAIRTAVALVGCSVLLAGIDQVTYYEEATLESLNPIFAATMPEVRTLELTHDRLFYRSAIDHTLKSRLADLSGVEPIDDGMALKIPLQRDIRWHDGKPFGPDDVCFTIDTLLDPSVAASPRVHAMAEELKGCDVLKKEHAVVVRFGKRFFNPMDRLSISILPAHVFDGTTVRRDLDYSSRPIGTGPMKASRGPQATTLVAIPNAHHNAKIPSVKQIPVGDPYNAVQSLVLGSVQGMIAVPPPHRPTVEASDDMALRRYDLRSWWFVAVNTDRGALRDRRVRQALDLSLDREELRKLTVGAQANDPNPPCEFISGPFVGSSPYYNRAVEVHERSDHARVEQLMTEVGAEKHFGKWVLGGKPITLKIGMAGPLDAEAQDLLNQLGNQLSEAGFDRQVVKVSKDTWNRQGVTGQLTDYDLFIGKWSFGTVEDVDPLFHTRTDRRGALNIFNYSSRDTDALLDRFEAARTDTEAQDAYHALHAHLAEELPYLFLWKLDTKSAWRNEIRGGQITPYYYFTEFDKWRADG